MGLFLAGESVIFPGRWETIKDAGKGKKNRNKKVGEKKKSRKFS